MKRENDEITQLFRSRLGEAEMTVREGFWEELNRGVAACHHHRQLVFRRVAAAASVLLVLMASSAAIWYFSPRQEMEEAFTQIATTAGGGMIEGDGVKPTPLPVVVEPVLPKPLASRQAPAAPVRGEGEVDSVSITMSMSFTFSSTSAIGGRGRRNGRRNGMLWQQDGNAVHIASSDTETSASHTSLTEVDKPRTWAVKAFAGTSLSAGHGYKIPVGAGLTVMKKLNRHFAVETGLLYSNLRSEEESLHYLGIPVKLNITFAESRKFDFYASVGGVADKCITGAPDNDFKSEPVQLAVTAGIGINYKINERIALFAEPGVSHHFKTDSPLMTVRTERPTNFNLLCGLRMTY